MSLYTIRLPVFEGPPDLLLYLVEKRELQPEDVEVAAVAAQCRVQLASPERLDLDAASEVLVTVARLLCLKARSLLPADGAAEETLPSEEGESGEAAGFQDFGAYRRARARAQALERLAGAQASRFTRPPYAALAGISGLPDWSPAGEGLSPGELAAAFSRVWTRHRRRTRLIPAQLLSVRRRMAEVLKTLRTGGASLFSALCRGARSRGEIIVTFLALLELVRRRKIILVQPEPFSDLEIGVRRRPRAGPEGAVQ